MHVERGYRMEAPDACPPEIYNIMKAAWDLDPLKRPTFNDVLAKLKISQAATV